MWLVLKRTSAIWLSSDEFIFFGKTINMYQSFITISRKVFEATNFCSSYFKAVSQGLLWNNANKNCLLQNSKLLSNFQLCCTIYTTKLKLQFILKPETTSFVSWSRSFDKQNRKLFLQDSGKLALLCIMTFYCNERRCTYLSSTKHGLSTHLSVSHKSVALLTIDDSKVRKFEKSKTSERRECRLKVDHLAACNAELFLASFSLQ